MRDDIPNPVKHPTTAEQATGGEDRIRAALAYLRRGLPRDGRSSGESSFAREEACLAEWAESMGLLLNPEDLPSKAVKGGQEHDLWHEVDADTALYGPPPPEQSGSWIAWGRGGAEFCHVSVHGMRCASRVWNRAGCGKSDVGDAGSRSRGDGAVRFAARRILRHSLRANAGGWRVSSESPACP